MFENSLKITKCMNIWKIFLKMLYEFAEYILFLFKLSILNWREIFFFLFKIEMILSWKV